MMRLWGLLLAGATLPAIVITQPALARDDAAPIVLAQNQDSKDQKKQQRQQERQQKQEQRQQERQQRQDSRQQRQDNRQQRQDAKQQRQDMQQEQLQQRQQKQEQQQKRAQEQQQKRQDLQQKAQEKQKNQQDLQQKAQDKQKRDERRDDRKDSRQERGDDKKGSRQDRDNRQDSQQERREDRKDSKQERRDDTKDTRQDRRDDRRDDSARRDDGARRLDQVRGERRERKEGNRTVIQEGNRTIIREGNRTIIRRDEADRFRRVGRDVNVQRFGSETRTVVVGPNGQRIVTVTGPDGRLIRRSRYVNNREVVIIDNRPRGGRAATAFFVALPAIAIASLAIPRDRYIVEAESAPPEYVYGALMAPPVEPLPRAYTLDEIRYSPEVRDRMPRIDLDTITFDSGSWEITQDQYGRLAPIAEGINRAIAKNPDEVFLIEGHTDATGTPEDNLSLSDRRAESISVILTDQFKIPPENLTTQGYGEQQLKIQSQGPERANRRVTVRRITPLLQQQAGAPPPGGPAPQ